MGDRQRKSGRLYVGNLPTECSNEDIENLFSRYGKIVDLVVKRATNGAQFAFVEFSESYDAEDAIRSKDGATFMGSRLRVEYPRGRREQDSNGGGRWNSGGGMKRGEYRVYIRGMPSSGSWQDLKDHMREAGDCAFADVQRDGTGVVEFSSRQAMDYALRKIDGSKFRCHQGNSARISVSRDPPRRGDRRDSRSRSRSRSRSHSRSRRRSGDRSRRRHSRSASRSDSRKSRDASPPRRSRSPAKSRDPTPSGSPSPKREASDRRGDSPRRAGEAAREESQGRSGAESPRGSRSASKPRTEAED